MKWFEITDMLRDTILSAMDRELDFDEDFHAYLQWKSTPEATDAKGTIYHECITNTSALLNTTLSVLRDSTDLEEIHHAMKALTPEDPDETQAYPEQPEGSTQQTSTVQLAENEAMEVFPPENGGLPESQVGNDESPGETVLVSPSGHGGLPTSQVGVHATPPSAENITSTPAQSFMTEHQRVMHIIGIDNGYYVKGFPLAVFGLKPAPDPARGTAAVVPRWCKILQRRQWHRERAFRQHAIAVAQNTPRHILTSAISISPSKS